MQIYGTFYGHEQRTNVSRYFVIYATDQGFLGGWVAPYDHEEMLARFAGNNLAQQNVAGARSVAAGAEKWEEHYNELLPDRAQFLEANKENFAFEATEISAVLGWKLKFIEKAATRFGTLDITPQGGKKRRFYLAGRRTPEEVIALVQKSLPDVVIEGAPVGNASQTLSEGDKTRLLKPVAPKPVWPILLGVGVAATLLSYLVVGQFNVWLPVVACVLTFKIFPLVRGGGAALNFNQNTAEQLQRDRAARDAQL